MKKNMCLYLRNDLQDQIEKMAREVGTTKSAIVALALTYWFGCLSEVRPDLVNGAECIRHAANDVQDGRDIKISFSGTI